MADLPDDFVSYLSAEARSAQAAVHQYLVNPYKSEGIHLFVEGDLDGAFYNHHARMTTGLVPYHYVCGGKAQVVEAFERLSAMGESGNVHFFVDRDHQEFIVTAEIPRQIFITDFYSFESYYIDERYVSAFLSDVLNLAAANHLHGSIVTNFVRSESSFAHAMRPFMALVLAIREKGGRVNLNNFPLDLTVAMDNTGLFSKRTGALEAVVKATVVDSGGITAADVLRWRRRLGLSSRLNWLRGKYYIWALFKYLQRIAQAVATARRRVGVRKGRVPDLLTNFAFFTASAPVPACPGSLAAELG